MNYKTILACATLLTSMLFFNGRLNAAVESDIVGYSTVEITREYTLLGVSFFSLSSDEDSVPVNEFLTGEFAHGDQIQIFNPETGSYDIAAWNSTFEGGKWCKERRGNPQDEVSSLVLNKGDGVWLKTANIPTTVTLQGRAVINTTVEYDCARQYLLVSLPIHEALSVNSTKLAWTNLTHADQIQVFNPETGSYDIAAWNSTFEGGKWCKERRGNPQNELSDLEIPAYGSAWIVSTSDTATCTFDSSK